MATATSLGTEQLDVILGLQLTVAWAGEKAAEPERLGWWNTDLTDANAGGDLFTRLLPKTAAWAGLQMAREAAIRADAQARSRLANPDTAQTLFHFGFEVDEALRDRLAHHKRHGHVPQEVLSAAWGVGESWDAEAFSRFLTALGSPKTEDTPAGRRVKKAPTDVVEAARTLAAALMPLAKVYPLPFADLKAE